MVFSDVIVLIFVKQCHRIVEEDIEVHQRVKGRSTVTTRVAFDTLWRIAVILMMFNPIRVFLPIATAPI